MGRHRRGPARDGAGAASAVRGAGRHRAAGARGGGTGGLAEAFHHTVTLRWRIARLAWSAGWRLVAANVASNLALGVAPLGVVVAMSVLLGRIQAAVGAGTGSAQWRAVLAPFAVAAACFAAQLVLAPWQAALGEHLANRVDGRMYDRLLVASLRSPGLAPLEDQRQLDHLSEAARELESGYQSPGRACAGLLSLIARAGQLLGWIVVVGVVFSWFAAGCVLAVVLAFRHSQRGGLRRYAAVFLTFAADRRRSRYLRQLAIGPEAAKEIRVFGLIDWLIGAIRSAHLGWMVPVWAHRRRVMLWPYLRFTVFGGLVTAGVLVWAAIAGARTLPLTGLALVLHATLGALRLGEFYPESDMQTQLGMAAYAAIRAFETGLDPVDPVPDTASTATRPPARVAGAIRYAGVGFRYPGQDRDVFTQLDLVIPGGACTAIVGVNGAGKTTLVKLLARLYEPVRGTITVDGVDIRSFAVDSWRERIAVLPQDFVRYPVSAGDNIGLGSVAHLHRGDRIRAAAAASGADAFLNRLPRGLDTPLASDVTGGVELSGGQWQRVALARALFAVDRGSAVLVLDEPTASLDVRAEARFLDEFARLTRGVTTILISHRFSTVRHADHIVVLEGGRALERGSHGELVRRDGRYAELFRRQAERFTGDAGAAA
jgi:ATP-binding cassette, subfamily B, bacterial